MKPGRFDYRAPTSLEEAVAALADHPGEARPLAGGQSLVPAMNFRLATPELLVDLNRVQGADRVRVEGSEMIVEMLVRHADLEKPVVDDPLAHLMAHVSRFVGHLPIRVRGTFAGSIAHADPAAEWCALAVALDATVVALSARGRRAIVGCDFFEGPFTTALEPDELVTEVRLPLLDRAGTGFCEQSPTAGDFATVAAVAVLGVEDGAVSAARIGIAGAESRPVRAGAAERLLVGRDASEPALSAASAAAAEAVDPLEDAHASADYKRHLVDVLVRRALTAARGRVAS